jgi:hypothetical protein
MQILSNLEFERLTAGQSYRLQAVAKRRAALKPQGHLQLEELPEYIKTCTYSGDHKSAAWLKSLVVLAKNGQLSRIRKSTETYADKQKYNAALHAQGAIKFKLNDAVMCKDCGKYGQVVDYLPESKEYIVVLDPFQIRTVKESELTKVG